MKREEEQQEERDKNNGNVQIINKVVNYNFMFEIPRQNVQPKKGPRLSLCAESLAREPQQPPKWPGIKRSMIFDTAYKDA